MDNGKTIVMTSGYGIKYQIGICGRLANAIENLFLSALHIFQRDTCAFDFRGSRPRAFMVRKDSRIE